MSLDDRLIGALWGEASARRLPFLPEPIKLRPEPDGRFRPVVPLTQHERSLMHENGFAFDGYGWGKSHAS